LYEEAVNILAASYFITGAFPSQKNKPEAFKTCGVVLIFLNNRCIGKQNNNKSLDCLSKFISFIYVNVEIMQL
jgi:hypothetical protein